MQSITRPGKKINTLTLATVVPMYVPMVVQEKARRSGPRAQIEVCPVCKGQPILEGKDKYGLTKLYDCPYCSHGYVIRNANHQEHNLWRKALAYVGLL